MSVVSPCRTPLYRELQEHPLVSADGQYRGHNQRSYHKGLWFERFFNRYDQSWTVPAVGKKLWLNGAAGSCGDQQQLDAANQRRIQLIHHLDGEFGIFKLDWHFVTGLGNAHPVENGFSWHPTLGTPWIPGSTVKGLVRAWVERELVPTGQCDQAQVYQLFGSESKDRALCKQDNRAGALIFFDAIPTGKVQLMTDIMTPHGGKWYEKGGTDQVMDADNLPGDWHSPVPVPFLVCKEASFLFGIAPREGCAVDADVLHQAMIWLEDALIFWGVGAKTATGYGHMDRDESSEKRLKSSLQEQAAAEAEKARLAEMALEERAMDALRSRIEKGEDKGGSAGCPLANDLSSVISQAMSDSWDARYCHELVELGKAIYQHLGIDLKKNKKAKERIKELAARCGQ